MAHVKPASLFLPDAIGLMLKSVGQHIIDHLSQADPISEKFGIRDFRHRRPRSSFSEYLPARKLTKVEIDLRSTNFLQLPHAARTE